MEAVEKAIQNQVLKVAETVEQQVDAEIQALEKLDIDDIEKLREKRLQDMKKQAKQHQEWLAMGHGEYSELTEEKEFFDVAKKSQKIVCHFYKSDTPRCKIVDHHLKNLCRSHIETRFCKLDVNRAPFLTGRLRIKVIPTIVLVNDGKTKDYIVGFTDLGNCDDFSTAMMEWRIAQSGAINYNGDLLQPPEEGKRSKKSVFISKKQTIRGKASDSDDDDDDYQ
ncbi:Viral IAP-associated factor homolog [Gryllus bimaculatus]|nr:Viral IAP-associated factor homolog [Gryllus bimaculatus]